MEATCLSFDYSSGVNPKDRFFCLGATISITRTVFDLLLGRFDILMIFLLPALKPRIKDAHGLHIEMVQKPRHTVSLI
uniref:Uncharacterized protein n=1 Tax=Noccaea caerulescens TaxID=107243 RepID=A0A1J3DBU3_NOCCA